MRAGLTPSLKSEWRQTLMAKETLAILVQGLLELSPPRCLPELLVGIPKRIPLKTTQIMMLLVGETCQRERRSGVIQRSPRQLPPSSEISLRHHHT